MKTLKLRIKDKHTDQLNRLSGSVNVVWNYVNDLGYKYLQCTGKFLSAYDLNEYTKGSGELLGLHSQTIQAINETHAKSRKQFKKAKLNWRTNNPRSKRKSLGWLPFKQSAIKHIATHQTGKKGLKSTLQLSLAKGQKLVIDLWDSSTYHYIKSTLAKLSKTAVTVGMPVSPSKNTLKLLAELVASALIWV